MKDKWPSGAHAMRMIILTEAYNKLPDANFDMKAAKSAAFAIIAAYEYVNRCVIWDLIQRMEYIENKKELDAQYQGGQYKPKKPDHLAHWMASAAFSEDQDGSYAKQGEEWHILPAKAELTVTGPDEHGMNNIRLNFLKVPVANPANLTAKGERMYQHVKQSYQGDPRAAEIASRTVLSRSLNIPGLVRNPAVAELDSVKPLADYYQRPVRQRSR